MKGKELNKSRNKRGSLLWMVMAACLILTGCASFGSISLNKAVNKYDDTVLQSEQQVLLLNIIRMHDNQPPHFTVASSVAATFTLSTTNGILPTWGTPSSGSTYNTLGLNLAATVSESPTITITPMQGKDFAERLLKPIDAEFVRTILLQQGGRMIDKMLRLVGADFIMIGPDNAKKTFESVPQQVLNSEEQLVNYNYPFANINDFKDKKVKDRKVKDFANEGGFMESEAHCLLRDLCYMKNTPPSIPSESTIKQENIDTLYHYGLFRKVVLHMKAMALSGRLNIFSLDFDVPKAVYLQSQKQAAGGQSQKPAGDSPKSEGPITLKDTIDALEKHYHWQEETEADTQKNGFMITKRHQIIALTDIDFGNMEYKKKQVLLKSIQKDLELNEEIKLGESMIIVLFRGESGNHWPIYGYFTVRNFRQVLRFLAESIEDRPGYEREYDVAPSKFTKELLGEGKNKKLQLGCFDNPALTLTINSASPPPTDRLIDVNYNGKSYWISSPRNQTDGQLKPPAESSPCLPRWNGEIFTMLYEIFEFNRTETAVSTPGISISK
jgi:hypothetical protein